MEHAFHEEKTRDFSRKKFTMGCLYGELWQFFSVLVLHDVRENACFLNV